MQLLLTTSQSFLWLDTESGESRPLHRGSGLYYGLARKDNRLYVAARNRQVSSTLDQANERGEILVFDDSLQVCASLRAPFPLRDLHEIAWHDEKLWATCSFDNMIALYDGENWERWFPLGIDADGMRDVNHFNSLMFDDDHAWILAHNRGPSELLAFSRQTRGLQKRFFLGNCGHNIWLDGGNLHTCSSAEGTVIGQHGFSVATGGFPRGMAFDGVSRCIGVSGIAERDERDFTTGKLMVFDLQWNAIKEIALPGEGLILDMMPFPEGFQLPSVSKKSHAFSWMKWFRS